MPSLADIEIPEIAAGDLQLQPVDDRAACGAIAALGNDFRDSSAAWVARDSITAAPRAYAALVLRESQWAVVTACGILGDAADAHRAGEVVTRFAKSALDLDISSVKQR